MKRFIALTLLWASFLSCSPDNDLPNYSYEVLPVASYEVPASFKVGETYTITLKYQRPSSCYGYQGIYYDKYLNVRTIGIQAVVDKDQVCDQALPPLSEVSFQFYASTPGSYIFKLYKGKDANGVSQFEEKEIKVDN
jgi:hypothetical protein